MRTVVKRTRTYDAIVALLNDGAWHALEDLRAITRFPNDWVDELEAEGVIDVSRGQMLTLVRQRAS